MPDQELLLLLSHEESADMRKGYWHCLSCSTGNPWDWSYCECCGRPRPVFSGGQQGKEPGIWIDYQEAYGNSPLSGPVLLTPEVWRQLNRAVEHRLAGRLSLWRKIWRKL